MLPGIDVSNWQSEPAWEVTAKGGVIFAAIKRSEGVSFPDPDFDFDWQQTKLAGLVRIAYHFCRPSRNTAAAELAYLFSLLPLLEAGDGFWIDFEDDPSGSTGTEDYRAWLVEFAQGVAARYGFAPQIYSRAEYLRRHNCAYGPDLAPYGLALASYSENEPTDTAGWPFFAFWQYGKGSVPGVDGPCDLDFFNGPPEALLLYCKPGTPAPTTLPFDVAARLRSIGFLAGGSGVTDMQAELAQYHD